MKNLGGELRAVWLPIFVIGFGAGIFLSSNFFNIGFWTIVVILFFVLVEIFGWQNSGAIFLLGIMSGAARVWVGEYSAHFFPALQFTNPLQNLHQYFDQQLSSFMSGPERALLSGLLFGGAQSFSREWREVFRITGTSHLVAVSGMNVSFVVAGIEWFLLQLRVGPRARLYYGVGLIGSYVILTGASASVMRAGLMALFGLLAPLVGRLMQPLSALAAAVVLMLFFNPTTLFDIGFQLSALATLGLIIFSNTTEPIPSSLKIWQVVAGAVQATLAATVFTLGVSTYYFGTFSALALVSNAVVVPPIAFLTLYGFIGLAVSIFSDRLAQLLTWPLYFLLHWLLEFLVWLAAVPGAATTFRPPLSAVVIYYLLVFIGSGYVYWRRHFR